MASLILVIDDDENLLKIYTDALSASGFVVEVAKNSEEGLVKAQTLKPNAILLDIMLPGNINGIELLEKLKSNSDLQNIPVIALTNLDTQKESAINAGAKDYLIKANFTPQQIVDKVKEIV